MVKIDIYDVVMQANAYASIGTGVPDRNWFPGAARASHVGRVDILDITCIAGPYGLIWGCTP
ncbi:MAG: hypothetical protein NWE91_03160 [Candidatus Bathyarchaeota archaeon]|nr:hypothetical protein [Candidatus Bathyarchaeota archaeon]